MSPGYVERSRRLLAIGALIAGLIGVLSLVLTAAGIDPPLPPVAAILVIVAMAAFGAANLVLSRRGVTDRNRPPVRE